ncbi:hypothetical protein K492DRAFT_174320 [Lichtheimia hyalospora FSU 10163]|nr:hypothetical protein K492DRAFT_174320 [Lichtheimia hyalospora FSU 10163]
MKTCSDIVFVGPRANQGQRRRELNREAQRAYRARKEQRIKDLEVELAELESRHVEGTDKLQRENEELRSMAKKMELELYMLKGAMMAMDKLSNIRSKSENSGGSHSGSSHNGSVLSGEFMEGASGGSSSSSSGDHTLYDDAKCTDPTLIRYGQFVANDFDHISSRIENNQHNDGDRIMNYTESWEYLLERSFFQECDLEELCNAVKQHVVPSGGIRLQDLMRIAREWETKKRIPR